VPRDVPLSPRLIQAAYKKEELSDAATLDDSTASDFSVQPEDAPEGMNGLTSHTAPEPVKRASEVMMATDESANVTVPDFRGKTMREVSEMCMRLGLEPVLVGSNLAIEQTPAPEANVKRGAKVTVQFGTPATKSAVKAGSVRPAAKPIVRPVRDTRIKKSGSLRATGSSANKR